ncbi:Lipopolysaccharide export system permease protein LptG [Nymphon striatum]|nr:Lipopolysaccharide export system permease protein LptG [Nymphon striatum]
MKKMLLMKRFFMHLNEKEDTPNKTETSDSVAGEKDKYNQDNVEIIVSAQQALLYIDPKSGNRIVKIENGSRYDNNKKTGEFSVFNFAEHGIHIPALEINISKDLETEPTLELLKHQSNESNAEIHWRLALILQAPVMALLAFPLSHTTPRQGRFGKLAFGILLYAVYANLIITGKSMIEDGRIPNWLGLWWTHILDRYLWSSTIQGILIAWLALVILDTFFAFINEAGKTNALYTTLQAIIYLIYTLPSSFYEFFPTSVLIGALLGLGNLAANSEFIAMRAAGVSIRNIVFSVTKLGALLAIGIFIVGEWLVPVSDLHARNFKAQLKNKNIVLVDDSGLWVKEKQSIIKIGKVLSNKHNSGNSIISKAISLIRMQKAPLKSNSHQSPDYLSTLRLAVYIQHLICKKRKIDNQSTISKAELLFSALKQSISNETNDLTLEYINKQCLLLSPNSFIRSIKRVHSLLKESCLAAPRKTRMISIMGSDGAGKTTLANHLLESEENISRLAPWVYLRASLGIRIKYWRQKNKGLMLVDRTIMDFLYLDRKTDTPRFSHFKFLSHFFGKRIPIVHCIVNPQNIAERKPEMTENGILLYNKDMFDCHAQRYPTDYLAFNNDCSLEESANALASNT